MKAYVDWIVGQALPFWAERGFDSVRDRFHERLDLAGRPLDVPHRAMVQARQIYVFAHAAERGWWPEGRHLAETAMATLMRDHRVDRDGHTAFLFSVDATGRPVSTVLDAYTQAFALFALAWLHRVGGDDDLLDVADRTIAFIEAELADPHHGGLFDAVPIADRSKRQNPLMHLLEAYLCLDRTAPDRGYAARADGIVALLGERLADAGAGILTEHFAEDWGAHPDPVRGRVFEPGHHLEWRWLLAEHARATGRALPPIADALHRTALAHGRAPDGLIWDEVGHDLAPAARTHRIWPHTEAMKAAIATGDAALAEEMGTLLLDRFLGRPFEGGWVDRIDEAGRPLVDHVPASSLYHLVLAAAEVAGPLLTATAPSPAMAMQD